MYVVYPLSVIQSIDKKMAGDILIIRDAKTAARRAGVAMEFRIGEEIVPIPEVPAEALGLTGSGPFRPDKVQHGENFGLHGLGPEEVHLEGTDPDMWIAADLFLPVL